MINEGADLFVGYQKLKNQPYRYTGRSGMTDSTGTVTGHKKPDRFHLWAVLALKFRILKKSELVCGRGKLKSVNHYLYLASKFFVHQTECAQV